MNAGAPARGWRRPLEHRLLLLLPFALATALALGSGQRLIQTVHQADLLARQVQELEREALSEELFQAKTREEHVADRFAAWVESLVDGEAGLRTWLDQAASSAARHGFAVATELGAGERLGFEGLIVEVVPVQLEIRPAGGPTPHPGPDPVVRLVNLVREIEAGSRAQRTTGLSIGGSGCGPERIRLAIHLWTIPPGP